MVMNDSGARVSRSSTTMSGSAIAAGSNANANTADDSASSITVNTTKAAPSSANNNNTNNGNTNNAAANNFPPPKTDKPRPHVCATCQRSFARLEHLKRHERSHTKEKPFECPECARCFARRDLLLRHQQKLHQSSTPSARPRNRRESTSGTPAQSRARKNSVANASGPNGAAGNSMRPRANTISHVDQSAMQMIAAASNNGGSIAPPRMPQGHGHGHGGHAHGHSRHPSLAGLPLHGFDHTFGGMAAAMGAQRGGMAHGLKIETAQANAGNDFSASSLRTAPPMAAFNNSDFDLETFMFGGGMTSSTINPNALHYNDSPPTMAMNGNSQASPFGHSFGDLPASAPLDDNFDWLTGFENTMSFANENVVEESSPSAISTTSQSGISDVMLDGSNHKAPAGTSAMWQSSIMGPPQMPNPFALDLGGSVFPDLLNGAPLSPQPASQKTTNDPYLSTPPPSMSSLSPSAVPGLKTQSMNQTLAFDAPGPDTPSSPSGGHHGASASSASPALPHSPVTTITDATRTTIVNALSQGLPHGGRRYSFTAQGSPQSPSGLQSAAQAAAGVPSTQDLRRFVGAYLSFFHPHLPFLHVPTLTFDPTPSLGGRTNGVGGRGCLIVSMAAIGALYEQEHAQAQELFKMAKKMIFCYLEERRKADVRKADMRRSSMSGPTPAHQDDPSHTPVWLVQAMLLNVVYGHNCGDKTAGDIASTHCAALVSLSQAADLLRPLDQQPQQQQDTVMGEDGNMWNMQNEQEEQQKQWLRWKTTEERKRTLYAVFVMSSLLVSAYNHAPALTNSEIFLDLPSDEEFFSAESATAFATMGGEMAANHNRMSFHDALGELLRTNERQRRQQQQQQQQFGGGADEGAEQLLMLPQSDLKPSTFGCMILINALHNYIWETRQRHHNKVWTTEETDKMQRHIEPALRAWQAAWASNPKHHVERPNPFGEGPLSADCIPLLDLAYIRLFVNMSRSKEKLWQRDWDGMAEEMSRGSDLAEAQQPHNNDSAVSDGDPTSTFYDGSGSSGGASEPSRREVHLRKAAFFAADSLSMADRMGLVYATDPGARERQLPLPLQAIMCAFDCAQVLGEWVATLQDRVGGYLGVLGRDHVDYAAVPAILLLEEEDVKLLGRVEELLRSAESKMDMGAVNGAPDGTEGGGARDGLAARILRVTAYSLDKAAVWPVTHLTARCLETQANHTRARAERSAQGA